MNKEEACKYIKMAADAGDVDDMYNYAAMLYKGDGIDVDKKEACKYFKMASERGNVNAMYNFCFDARCW